MARIYNLLALCSLSRCSERFCQAAIFVIVLFSLVVLCFDKEADTAFVIVYVHSTPWLNVLTT